MVIRPPIESWTRPELEDRFHTMSDNHRELQKTNKELEKKITQLTSRFRKSILERKTRNDQVVDKDKYDELVRDNELLLMKLKTTKHQLLTYTAPNARSTTYSALTGRSNVPVTGIRKYTPNAPSGRSTRGYGTDDHIVTKLTDRPISSRISDSNLNEKANVIKLNRLLREKNTEVAELQYEIERLNTLLKTTKSEIEIYKTRPYDTSEFPATGVSTNVDNQLRNEHESLARKELELVKKELDVLKETNETLVKQLLNHEFSGGATDIVELRKDVVVLEEKLREAEKREREIGKKRRQERRQFDEWKQRYRSQMKNTENREAQNHVVPQYQQEIDEITPRSDLSYTDHRRKKKQKMVQDKSDDVLLRLYNDVVGLLETHSGAVTSNDLLSDGVLDPQSIEKWQKMYSELYDELEKVRNMLLLQHNINQKQNVEISVLKEEYEKLQLTAEEKLNVITEDLKKKHQEVIILEEKIRQIAYAGQKPITIGGVTLNDGDSLHSELSVRLLSLRFHKSYVNSLVSTGSSPSAIFLSLEFFDFELQTTPHLQFIEKQPMDHTTVYNLVCSNLFIHYLQTNGITIEMYRPQSNSYTQMAAAVISLNTLLQKKNHQKYESSVHFMDIKTGQSIAVITYEITIGQDLKKAISSYKKAECAQQLLPLDVMTEAEDSSLNQLIVAVHRCSGIEQVLKTPVELCVVYELLGFSPFFTETAICSGNSVELKSQKAWPIPLNQAKFMKEQSITFFLINMADDKKGDGILGLLTLPLLPLLGNQAIKGSFTMVEPTLEDTQLVLDLSIFWKHCLISDRNNNSSNEHTDSKDATNDPTSPISDLKRERTEGNIIKSNGIDASPLSSASSSPSLGQRKPSVLESPDEELWERPRIVEIVRSPSSSSSSRSSSITTVEELDRIPPSNPPPKPRRRSSKESEKPSSPPKLLSESSSNITSSDDNSDNSHNTYTKEKVEGNVADESVESDGMPVESERKREQDRNEVKSLLGDLPPIAKPRISKLQSDSRSSSLFQSAIQEPLESSSESDESSQKEKKSNKSGRNVVFTHPLHHSIPPSESSSLASPTGKREKPSVSLPDNGGRSVIKSLPRPIEFNFPVDNTIVGSATLYIDRVYNFEFSPLMHPSYQNSKLYIDWTFLDFPAEECRVPESRILDHSQQPITLVFNYTKEYKLTRKDIALLEQYIELQNKLEFCLMTDTGEDSEELAVALLELVSNPTEQIITLSLLDVNGIKYANIDLALYYSVDRNVP
ncbi:unnamed protein product [Auanema sp. JU1783]|nr:unnamed protein product [Auanema sp. JU1783]